MGWNSKSTDVIIAALVIALLGCVLMCVLTYCFAKRNYNKHLKQKGIKATKGHQRFDDSHVDENAMNVETPSASGGEFLGANSIEMTGIESRTGLATAQSRAGLTHTISDNDGDISTLTRTASNNPDDDVHHNAMLRAPSPGPMRSDTEGMQSVGVLPPTSPSLSGRNGRADDLDVMGAPQGRNGSQMHFPGKNNNNNNNINNITTTNNNSDPTRSEQDMQQVEEALFA